MPHDSLKPKRRHSRTLRHLRPEGVPKCVETELRHPNPSSLPSGNDPCVVTEIVAYRAAMAARDAAIEEDIISDALASLEQLYEPWAKPDQPHLFALAGGKVIGPTTKTRNKRKL